MGHLIRDVCASASALPTTGADPTRVLVTAAALVVIGAMLLLWRRRARRVLSAVAIVLGILTFVHTPTPRVDAACDPAVTPTVAAATATTSTTLAPSTTTTLAESSPPVASRAESSTTVATVLSQSTTSSSTTSSSTTTTVAPPNVVPDVPAPALAGASFLIVMLGARGLLARDRTRRRTV